MAKSNNLIRRTMNGLAPNIIRGGNAIELGNNLFFVQGRSHNNGGVDVGNNLEVEGGEIIQVDKDNVKVFSARPFLGGHSPSQLVLAGNNPETVFALQEKYKPKDNNDNKIAQNGIERKMEEIRNDRQNAYNKIKNKFEQELRKVTTPINQTVQTTVQTLTANKDTKEKYKGTYNFSNIKSAKERIGTGVNDLVSYAYDYFINNGLSKKQAAVVLSNIIWESGGNPLSLQKNVSNSAIENGSAGSGLLQWSKGRYYDPNKYFKSNLDLYEELDNQLSWIVRTLDKAQVDKDRFSNNVDEIIRTALGNQWGVASSKSRKFKNEEEWDGDNPDDYKTPYATTNDAYTDYLSEDLDTISKALFYGFIRPKHYNEYTKRRNFARDIYNYVEQQDALKENEQLNKNEQTKEKTSMKNGGLSPLSKNQLIVYTPFSTGEKKGANTINIKHGDRDKAELGLLEWNAIGQGATSLLGNLVSGIGSSIVGNRLKKLYNNLTRTSTYVPVAREHINTTVDVNPQLDAVRNAQAQANRMIDVNTNSSKATINRKRSVALNSLAQGNTIYGDKLNRETQLRNAEAQLQTQYNMIDNANKIKDIEAQNDFEMQRRIGLANAGNTITNGWMSAAQNVLGDSANIFNNMLSGYLSLAGSQNKELADIGISGLQRFGLGSIEPDIDIDGNLTIRNPRRYKRFVRNN